MGAQLYTVRNFTKTAEGLHDTLKRVSEIGYGQVQMSAVDALFAENPETDAKTVKTWLDDLNLKCSATHRPIERLETSFAEEVQLHHDLGCSYAAIGSLPWSMKDNFVGAEEFLAKYEKLALQYQKEGIDLGIHNHAWDAKFILDHITGGPIQFEMDVYWAKVGGVDLETAFKALKGQLWAVHLKDMPADVAAGTAPEGTILFAAVGEGVMDWNAVVPALMAAGTESFLIEQDECPRDPFDCLRSSFEYLCR